MFYVQSLFYYDKRMIDYFLGKNMSQILAMQTIEI